MMNKPKYNPEMQLSENFRLKEFIESPLGAERQGREKAEVTGNIATPHSAYR